MKRSALLLALMMTVAVLAPAVVANASDVASVGGATTVNERLTAQEWKAEMIAGYFAGEGAAEGDVAAAYELVLGLRAGEPAMGWGVLSKLALYAAAGMDIDEFLASAQDEDGGYSMGQLRKEYELGGYDELRHKNFGQMQKAEKPAKPDKADKKKPPGQLKKSQG
jgi:hypothetical protein